MLDILITWHLYQSHTEIDPGELTDLRSASVNNENFAHAAVRRNLHPHLQHSSGFLADQIKDYVKSVDDSHVKSVDDSHSITKPFQSVNGPKVHFILPLVKKKYTITFISLFGCCFVAALWIVLVLLVLKKYQIL